MAIKKTVATTSLSIEVQSGTDKSGDPTYTKKTFSGIKDTAQDQDIYDVAEAIKKVMADNTRNYFVNQSANITVA